MKRGVGRKFIVVSLAALVAGGGLGSFVVMDGPAKVGIKGVPDLLAMMRDRSPGERSEGALSKKEKLAQTPVAAAAAERDSPEKQPEAAAAPVAAVVPLVAPAAAIPAAIAALPAAVPAAVPAAGLLAIPPLLIPGGSGGNVNVGVTPPPGGGGTTPPPPPGPPVPEPATWLMMIIGFGMVGGVLRRKKSRSSVQDGKGEADSVVLSSSALQAR